MILNTTMQSNQVLSLSSRGYRFSASYNGKGYTYREQKRDEDGILKTKESGLITNKNEIINAINFSYLDRQCRFTYEKEHLFLLDSVDMLPKNNDIYNLFFHDKIRELVGDKTNSVVEKVGMMEVDVYGDKIVLSEIEYVNEPISLDNVEVSFNFVRDYIDIDRLIEIIKISITNKHLMSFQFILHTNSDFNNTVNSFLFDQPIFIDCFSVPNESVGKGEQWLTTFSVFSNNLWNGNFMNFIK